MGSPHDVQFSGTICQQERPGGASALDGSAAECVAGGRSTSMEPIEKYRSGVILASFHVRVASFLC
jgi:hypothetical protein